MLLHVKVNDGSERQFHPLLLKRFRVVRFSVFKFNTKLAMATHFRIQSTLSSTELNYMLYFDRYLLRPF